MNNPNPFVPQGSLLDQQSKRRSRLKFGVFAALAIGIVGLAAMLIQGCKREQDQNPPESDNNPPAADTNAVSAPDTNLPPAEASNAPTESAAPQGGQQQYATPAPTVPPPAPAVPMAPAPSENEYVVVKGDYMAKIARENGVTLRALEDANPGVLPTHLKIGQKLVIPAGASTTGANAAGETAAGVAANGDVIYVVKSGDNLSKIAHHYGVTVKAIEKENGLGTTKIKVGQKLQIPGRPETAPAPVNAPPAAPSAPETAPANNSPAPPQQSPPPQQ